MVILQKVEEYQNRNDYPYSIKRSRDDDTTMVILQKVEECQNRKGYLYSVKRSQKKDQNHNGYSSSIKDSGSHNHFQQIIDSRSHYLVQKRGEKEEPAKSTT